MQSPAASFSIVYTHFFLCSSLGNEIIGGTGFNRAQYSTDYNAFRAAVTASAPSWAQDVVGPSAAGFPGDAVISPFLSAVAGLDGMSISIHAYSFGKCDLSTYTDKAGIEKVRRALGWGGLGYTGSGILARLALNGLATFARA